MSTIRATVVDDGAVVARTRHFFNRELQPLARRLCSHLGDPLRRCALQVLVTAQELKHLFGRNVDGGVFGGRFTRNSPHVVV